MAACKNCVHVEVCSYTQNSNNAFEHCANFRDRSRFVELPNDFPKGRLTTNKPLGNFDALMNYAYLAKLYKKDFLGSDNGFVVTCITCGSQGARGMTRKEAADKWNRRALNGT